MLDYKTNTDQTRRDAGRVVEVLGTFGGDGGIVI